MPATPAGALSRRCGQACRARCAASTRGRSSPARLPSLHASRSRLPTGDAVSGAALLVAHLFQDVSTSTLRTGKEAETGFLLCGPCQVDVEHAIAVDLVCQQPPAVRIEAMEDENIGAFLCS